MENDELASLLSPAGDESRAPRRGAANSAEKRLLEAALDAFASRGFHGTTTRQIADAAEMSPAGLYSQFRSKEELLYQICLNAHNIHLTGLRIAFSSTADPRERIEAMVRSHVLFHAMRKREARVANYEMTALSRPLLEDILRIRREAKAVVLTALEIAASQFQFASDDLDLAAILVLSLGIDVARWFSSDGRLTPDDLATAYSSRVMRMLGEPLERNGGLLD